MGTHDTKSSFPGLASSPNRLASWRSAASGQSVSLATPSRMCGTCSTTRLFIAVGSGACMMASSSMYLCAGRVSTRGSTSTGVVGCRTCTCCNTGIWSTSTSFRYLRTRSTASLRWELKWYRFWQSGSHMRL